MSVDLNVGRVAWIVAMLADHLRQRLGATDAQISTALNMACPLERRRMVEAASAKGATPEERMALLHEGEGAPSMMAIDEAHARLGDAVVDAISKKLRRCCDDFLMGADGVVRR